MAAWAGASVSRIECNEYRGGNVDWISLNDIERQDSAQFTGPILSWGTGSFGTEYLLSQTPFWEGGRVGSRRGRLVLEAVLERFGEAARLDVVASCLCWGELIALMEGF